MGLDIFGFGEEREGGRKLRKFVKEMNGKYVAVGFTDKSGTYEDGASVAQIAAFNEFGTDNMPARPFMRQTKLNNGEKIHKFMQKSIKENVESGSVEQMLNQVGSKYKGFIQKEIRNGEFEPNAPSTVRKKGSSRPLIDTGRMRQSVVYEIREE